MKSMPWEPIYRSLELAVRKSGELTFERAESLSGIAGEAIYERAHGIKILRDHPEFLSEYSGNAIKVWEKLESLVRDIVGVSAPDLVAMIEFCPDRATWRAGNLKKIHLDAMRWLGSQGRRRKPPAVNRVFTGRQIAWSPMPGQSWESVAESLRAQLRIEIAARRRAEARADKAERELQAIKRSLADIQSALP